MSENLTDEQLHDAWDTAEKAENYRLVSEIRGRLRTICQNCRREGADDHYDTHGIYAGRWHDQCATPADKHRENYHWSPGDEPLEDE